MSLANSYRIHNFSRRGSDCEGFFITCVDSDSNQLKIAFISVLDPVGYVPNLIRTIHYRSPAWDLVQCNGIDVINDAGVYNPLLPDDFLIRFFEF